MVEGIDFYYNDDGFMVFTETYHRKRGYCCKNKCRHCPWQYGRFVPINPADNKEQDEDERTSTGN